MISISFTNRVNPLSRDIPLFVSASIDDNKKNPCKEHSLQGFFCWLKEVPSRVELLYTVLQTVT